MAGNWKMNQNHQEAVVLVQKLAWTLSDKKHDYAKVEVVVLPPYTDLRSVQTLVDGDRLPIKYGAQDVSVHDNGAYTGEISATMLSKLGCSYVVVGHSERREYHGETDEIVNAKAKKAIAEKMTPIVCVGEGLEVRKEAVRSSTPSSSSTAPSPTSSRRRWRPWSSRTSPCGRSAPGRSRPRRTPRRSARRSVVGSPRSSVRQPARGSVSCTAAR
jgi:hypothetical protein